MTKRILRSIIFASIVTGLTCIVFIMGILYDYFNKSLLNELKIEATLVEQGVELYGEKYFDSLETEGRITWIDRYGRRRSFSRKSQRKRRGRRGV